jgi:dipeptidyl aminopeptidase/acylaminoacyl peptidase
MLNRLTITPLLAIAAIVVLALPSGAGAASSGGAVVFSKVVTKTVNEVVRDKEGNPVKDKDGKEEVKVTTTVEGGLFAVRDGHLNQLTEDSTDTEPAFSPNGRAIAYVRGGDVFSVRADGSGLRQLSNGSGLDSAPTVSPNGKFVVFERRAAAGAPADLYSVRLLGGGLRALTNTPADDHEASFSGDGRTIVFVRSVAETGGGTADDIYSMRASGANQARLTRTGRIDEFGPHFFAGGIAFSRGENGEAPSAYADVYTMRRNGSKVRSLVAGSGSAYVQDVSPDGHTLLFRRDQGLWVKRIGPKRAQKLGQLPDGSHTNAVFSSDGKRVAAFIAVDGRQQLSSINVASRGATELAAGFNPSETSESSTGGTTSTIGPVMTWQPVRR